MMIFSQKTITIRNMAADSFANLALFDGIESLAPVAVAFLFLAGRSSAKWRLGIYYSRKSFC